MNAFSYITYRGFLMRRFFLGFVFVFAGIFLVSCSLESCKENPSGDSFVSVVNWNVQTFFDSQTSGSEYSNFRNSVYWDEEKYRTRLKRLCDVITILDADIFIFEEIENEGILYDIYNQLSGNSWNQNKIWNYGSFYKDENSSIGLAALSKIPLEDMKIHSMDIRIMDENQPSSRPTLELKISLDGKDLFLFVNHWKSKVSGIQQGEIWRQWQEFVLSKNILQKERFLICGDFNKDIDEFIWKEENSKLKICLRNDENNICVFSPWINNDKTFTTKIGSYYYKENWERIDNFFINDNITFQKFEVCTNGEWITDENIPKSYKIFTGEGFSDHLPIMCKIGL